MNIFIRQQDDVYQWFKAADSLQIAETQTGSLSELAQFYKDNSGIKNWVLVAPGLDVAYRTIEYSEKEKKHIIKAIPFMLEESLLSEADYLQVLMEPSKDKDNAMDVVSIDEKLLQTWLECFDAAGIRITHCIAESLFLPESDAQWQIFYRANVFLIRAQSGETVAIEAEHFALSLELLSDGYSHMPAQVDLITESEDDYQKAMALMPVPITPLVKPIILPYADMLQSQFNSVAKGWNFLSGKFAVAREWLALVKPWRWVVASLVAVFVLNITLIMTDLAQKKEHNAYLRTQMDATFRQVIPRGNIVDHRRQLERHLKTAAATGSGAPFIQQLNKIGKVLNKHGVQSLNSLNYDLGKSELRLDLLVKDSDVVQAILADLKALALDAEIQNSNAQGDQLRTRLRITG